MDDFTAKVNTIITDVPLPTLFLGVVAFLLVWTFLAMIKDALVWMFWNIFWYFIPFFLWYFHPTLKPYYVMVWVFAMRVWKDLIEMGNQALNEQDKQHV